MRKFDKKMQALQWPAHFFCYVTVKLPCLDEVEGLGTFLELEIMAEDESSKASALEKIERILKELGYEMEETTRVSYLTQLLEKAGGRTGYDNHKNLVHHSSKTVI